MATWRGYDFVELVKDYASPQGEWSHGRSRCTRLLLCDWSDMFGLSKELLGYPALTTGTSSTAYISRRTPHRFTDNTGERSLYAARVGWRGHGIPDAAAGSTDAFPTHDMVDTSTMTEGGLSLYKKCILTVEYEGLPYIIKEDDDVRNSAGDPDETTLSRYVSIKFKPSAQYLTMPRGAMKWVASGTPPVPFGVPRLESKVAIDITWHQVPFVPSAATEMQGKVNSVYMNIALPGAPSTVPVDAVPGTLLYLTFDQELLNREITGEQLMNLHYHFQFFNPQDGLPVSSPVLTKGHNYLLGVPSASDPIGYYRVSDDGTAAGRGIFQTGDLSQLFNPV